MKTVQLTTPALQDIAKKVNGNLWFKDQIKRIYLNDRNSEEIKGKWFYEISPTGEVKARCFINEGFTLKTRRAFVEKQLKDMESLINSVIAGQPEPQPAPMQKPAPVKEPEPQAAQVMEPAPTQEPALQEKKATDRKKGTRKKAA